MARALDAIGGGVFASRIASSATLFQSVTTSGEAVAATDSDETTNRQVRTSRMARLRSSLVTEFPRVQQWTRNHHTSISRYTPITGTRDRSTFGVVAG